jgi:hypothetical protein
MEKSGTITGLEKVTKALHQKVRDLEKANVKGFVKSIILIRNELEKTTPMVPLDLGNLRASFYSVTAAGMGKTLQEFVGEDGERMKIDHSKAKMEGAATVLAYKGQIAVMGFSANYAWWVHENIGNVNWSKEGSGAKFFSKALDRNETKILDIIAEEAKKVI